LHLNLKQEKEISMNAFALDKNYNAFNFAEISLADLEIISGGSGGSTAQCILGTVGGAIGGALGGAAAGSAIPGLGTAAGAIWGGIGGGMAGAAASCFG
jgi:hypothetical protein